MPRIVEIDGRNFRTLDEFFEVIGEKLVPGKQGARTFDAFNDILCWPLAHDPDPYVLVWRRSNLSRRRLNHLEVERHWEAVVQAGGRKAGALQAKRIAEAARCEGPTAFDMLVEIIQKHPDWLSLRLE